jgi:hypothetical protein
MGRPRDELAQPLLADDAEAGSGTPPAAGACDAAAALNRSGGVGDDTQLSPLFAVCPFILANEFCERLAYYGLATNLVMYCTGALALRSAQALDALAPDPSLAGALTRARRPRPADVMRYSKADAAAVVQSWSASCYITALLGAVVADSALGRCAPRGRLHARWRGAPPSFRTPAPRRSVRADAAPARCSYRTILLFASVYFCGLVLLTCCAGLVPAWAPAPGADPTRRQTGAAPAAPAARHPSLA